MKRAAVAGFAAGAAMVIGGALGAVSNIDPRPIPDIDVEVMNPMIGGQAMLPDRDIMENMSASPMHTTFVNDLKDTGVAARFEGQWPVHGFCAHKCGLRGGVDSAQIRPGAAHELSDRAGKI